MIRKIGISLLLAVASLSTSVHAFPSHPLQAGLTLEYDLPPHEPQLFVNFMFWPVEANCKIVTVDVNDELVAEVIARKARVNDAVLTEGQSVRVTVLPGQNLKIGADSGAKVKITNMGESLVKAICTA